MRNFFILLLLLPWLSAAQTATESPKQTLEESQAPFTLKKLLELSSQHNLLLKISSLAEQITRQEYRQARALPNPEVELATGKMKFSGSGDVAENVNNLYRPVIWSAGIKWSLPNPLAREFHLRGEKQNISLAAIEHEKKQKELSNQVKIHYYELCLWLKNLEILNRKHKNLDDVNAITVSRVEVGEAPATDKLRSSVELQKINSQRFKAEKNVTRLRDKLREMLNFALPADFTVANSLDDSEFTPFPAISDKDLKILINYSPRIRESEVRYGQAANQHRAAGFSLIDNIELFAEKEKEADGEKWKVGLGVAIPLFDQKGALQKKTRLQKEKTLMELHHHRNHFLAEVQQSISQVRVLEKEITSYRGAILQEGRTNLELTEALYKAGEVSLMLFLDARNSFFEIEERYYEAITEWRILKASLEEQLGVEL